MQPSQHLTRVEAAAYLGVSAFTLNQWASQGKGPRSIKVGRQCVYKRVDLDAYKAGCNHPQASQPVAQAEIGTLPAGAYILRLPQVVAMTGLSKSSLYGLMRKSQFPASISLGPRAVGWPSHLVQQWLADRINRAEVAV
ncbi:MULTISPECIES: helix-turn-helix transcriptional regulator [Vogesella]|uniref:Helix-turn-helix domain-containing protein n=1 Tax=Vogesella alkaliphila TaxID=1193621 RepID=A0ABQ2YYW8_9NEIS|nr:MULTISPECIES: AlpA family phage regulatory protein [Vogesella]MDC7709095.1 AlpA family phage regulatory protein [Vogesella indigofera]GGX99957.1 hypothetical protein GCM10011290_29970 [Vogesella alkaliphila]